MNKEQIRRQNQLHEAREIAKPISKRDKTIIRLIWKEKTSAEMGKEMGISMRTVEGYRRLLMKKAKVNGVVGLMKFGLKEGIITLPK